MLRSFKTLNDINLAIYDFFDEEFKDLSGESSFIASIWQWSGLEVEWEFINLMATLYTAAHEDPEQKFIEKQRQTAENLRSLGELEDAEKIFLEIIETAPPDFKVYIGLGKIYLEMGRPEEAKAHWEIALSYAPRTLDTTFEINFGSYIYRLIGRIFFCQEKYKNAVLTLKKAIELEVGSVGYYHYDYAQYCALVGDKENCLNTLEFLSNRSVAFIEFARKEINFAPYRKEIESL
ncbi:MAG: tetratricopeptide repeat protein, partial [Candidatus Heimdallarchaeota archaeon]